jgi:serine/threonine protein kinase
MCFYTLSIATIISPSQSHLPLVAPEAMPRDLTKYITKTSEFYHIRGALSEVWKCILKTDQGSIDVCLQCFFYPLVWVWQHSRLQWNHYWCMLLRVVEQWSKSRKWVPRRFGALISNAWPCHFQRIFRELKTCARLNHQNILPVHGYTTNFGPFVAIVSPWVESGNLNFYLEKEDQNLPVIRRFEIVSIRL